MNLPAADPPALLGGVRARDLPALDGIEALRAHLLQGRTDGSLLHAAGEDVAQTPQGLQRGVVVFGPGSSPVMLSSPSSLQPMRAVASVLLHDASFVASSMTVVDRRQRLFLDGIDNLGDPSALAGFDPNYRAVPGGIALAAEFVRTAEHVDCVALPVCGVGFPNYGHFLYDGLPAVLLHAHAFPELPLAVVGQRLAPWQREILDGLGLLGRYLEVRTPVVFRRVLASTLLALHVSYPTRFIRPVFDLLRFRFGAGAGGPPRLFLSRAGHDGRRRLRNRPAVEAAMAAMGYAVVRTSEMSVAEQAALVGSAQVVVGESGAAMANLGFCLPGTKVLEIQPERFVEGWTRGMCLMLGHRWHVYFAKVDAGPSYDEAARPLDPSQHFSFEVDPLELTRAVRTVEQA